MSEADNRAPRRNAGAFQAQRESRSSEPLGAEALAVETRMRRALGLSPGAGPQTAQQRPEQARARHRFVQDGGVPVVMLNHKPDQDAALRERVGALEAQLEAERAAHAGTRRMLTEQQASYQALQTRLVHAELAHTEALETERRLRLAAQQALVDVQPAPARHGRPTGLRPVLAAIIPEDSPEVTEVVAPPAVKRGRGRPKLETVSPEKPKRGRPRIHPVAEPKPVRWWTPSFKAKSKA